MTELSFAKSFLSTLDSRPTKIPAEHAEDPRKYPARAAYILPKMSKPLPKRQKLAPGQERSINVSLKSLRNPPLDITLKSQPPTISVLDLKSAVSRQTNISVENLRLLYKKKPAGDSKILKDLIAEEESNIEFSIMVMGGAASMKQPEEAAPVAQGLSGSDVLASEEFWGDLKGFLTQRLRDEGEGRKVFTVFKTAWESKAAS